MTKDRIEKLIAKGELKTALDELLAWTKGKAELAEVYKEAVLIAGRLAKLEHKNIIGELDHKEIAQQENQIRNAVLSALGQVPALAWNATETNAESKLGELRTDPLLLDFVKKYAETYEKNHALLIDLWEDISQKHGKMEQRDLLKILREVCRDIQIITQLATTFVAKHFGKLSTDQRIDFTEDIQKKYGDLMSTKEMAALLEKKRINFEEFLKDFVWVKEGEFMMGAVNNDNDALVREKPQHRVRLSGFYLSKNTVTLGQFAEFVENTGYQTDADKEGFSIVWNGEIWEEKFGVNWRYAEYWIHQNDQNRPVIHVSWKDAIAFCNYWNQKHGFAPTYDSQGNLLNADGQPTHQIHQVVGFRLPSEAEWEYACRAGTTTRFYTGDALSKDHANFDNHLGYTQPIYSYPANPWGLYDMLGNVWEWCQDVYVEQFYAQCLKQGMVENPLNLEVGVSRVIRGGSWIDFTQCCRPSFRDSYHPTYSDDSLSFRVALFSNQLSGLYKIDRD